MEKDKIDIRIIHLAKWRIPKSESVLQFCDKDTYLSIGYFDMIHVEGVKGSPDEHPLLQAYKESHRYQGRQKDTDDNKKDMSEDYSIQEMLAFTNQSEKMFPKDVIEAFWSEQSWLLFVSLIHIDNESDIEKIVEEIKQKFGEKKYLIYFSFDYSGIILFAKGMGLKTYLKLIFQLNYARAEKEKLIRDSYSLYGIESSLLKGCFEQLKEGKKSLQLPDYMREEFSVSVNIGIQNYATYDKLMTQIKTAYPDSADEYGLFGRHDVSVVNKSADWEWLIRIQYFLDQCIGEHTGPQYQTDLFSTYETFVKIPGIGSFQDADPKDDSVVYRAAKESLENLCKQYFRKLSEREPELNGEYRIPVQAVCDSILSILKNRFAEDFVYCMFQSFCAFLEYLIEKMSAKTISSKEFDACYSAYFHGLNSLVNSTMHSERQFIQATAFNAIIYDVPSKIMAFYMAVINDIQNIIRGEQDQKYTFLLTPSFHNEIAVKVISYEEKPPHDRILMVSINEQSLYNPKALIKRMAHETAHFLGDKLRNRELRKKNIKMSMIQFALTRILYQDFFVMPGFDELISDITQKLPKDKRFLNDKNWYSHFLYKMGQDLTDEFEKNESIRKRIREFVLGSLGKCYEEAYKVDYLEQKEGFKTYILHIANRTMGTEAHIIKEFFSEENILEVRLSKVQLETVTNLIMEDIDQEISVLNTEVNLLLQSGTIVQSSVAAMRREPRRYMGEYVKCLISSGSEAFADVQMILLMGMKYEEYLSSFIVEEKVDLDKLVESPEDLIRFTVVAMTLNYTGIWEDMGYDMPEKTAQDVLKFHNIIRKHARGVEGFISEEEKQALGKYRSMGESFRGQFDKEEAKKTDKVLNQEIAGETDHQFCYANLYLIHYLVECVKDSLEQYGQKEVLNKIKRLRKDVDTVVTCKDIKEVFSTVCKVIKDYKRELFPQIISQTEKK